MNVIPVFSVISYTNLFYRRNFICRTIILLLETILNIHLALMNIFQSYYPNRDNSDCLNFAFCYPESEWIAKNMCKKYYNGKVPEVIYG